MANQILKRLSNILTIVVYLILFGLSFLAQDLFEESSIKGIGFILIMLLFAFSALTIGILNYIFFGFFALWHSGIGINEELEKQNDKQKKEKQAFLIPFYLGFKNDFLTHVFLNVIRGAYVVIIFSMFYFIIGGLFHFFGWTCAFRDDTCDPDSYFNIFDFFTLINLNYYIDILVLYIIGFLFRFNDEPIQAPATKFVRKLEHKVHKRYEGELSLIGEGSRVSHYQLYEDIFEDEDS